MESKGWKLNASGGKTKGTPQQLLKQSSTLADLHPIDFNEGTYKCLLVIMNLHFGIRCQMENYIKDLLRHLPIKSLKVQM